MKENEDLGKHEKDASQSYRKIEEEQTFIDKEIKKEILICIIKMLKI